MKALEKKRPLTAQERDWLLQGLQALRSGQYRGGQWIDPDTGDFMELYEALGMDLPEPIDPSLFIAQVPDLVVVAMCDCGSPGCHTIEFERVGSGPHVNLQIQEIPDGRLVMIFIDRSTAELSQLEILGTAPAPDASRARPALR